MPEDLENRLANDYLESPQFKEAEAQLHEAIRKKNKVRITWISILFGALMFFLFLLFCPEAKADTLKESDYQLDWCLAHKGIVEHPIPDSKYPSRVDCLTDVYAIEFDFLRKWPEALTQAIYYGKMTHRKPGVVFIIENTSNEYNYVYINRLLNTLSEQKTGITFWFVYK